MQDFVRGYQAPFPIRYLWQPDEGFRKSRMLNESLRHAQGAYIVFADSDCIPHHHYLKDHWSLRKVNTVLCGRRVDMGEFTSSTLTAEGISGREHEKIRWPLVKDILRAKTLNWEESIRVPVLGSVIHWKSPSLLGSNFSLEKSLIERINGFNEDYVGYGYEDPDLEHRLRFAGARLKAVRHAAIQYHIYHTPSSTSDKNKGIFEATVGSGNPVCRNGLRKL
jgi:GT2 family glycosyltransferase